ncbi:MAG: histidine kinase dimerization/phospho-acceptor domain-containing protein [Terrimicrobiaceae bacterium]|nr:histidine kinase dimerization/phospho-acceptor domain-containing protein [Terrimicrobiaceae bacterium]
MDLANHTLLIRKDGSEVPFDDSGAPVREADGSLRGVILVFRDFSRYKAAEREQLELKQRLEVANAAKDQFLATLSHELRTPLTPVLATLSVWESKSELPEPFAGEVKLLARNVRLEARLIDDLLDLTRISRGQMTLRAERVDVHGLLAAIVEIHRSDVDRRRIDLRVRWNRGAQCRTRPGSAFVVRLPPLAEPSPVPAPKDTTAAPRPAFAPIASLLLEDHEDSADVLARIMGKWDTPSRSRNPSPAASRSCEVAVSIWSWRHWTSRRRGHRLPQSRAGVLRHADDRADRLRDGG